MTLEQAKDRAAYLMYSKRFDEITNTDAVDHRLRTMEKAAELYGRAKWDEALLASERLFISGEVEYYTDAIEITRENFRP